MSRRQLIEVAMGRAHADSIIGGGRLVNVFTREVYDGGVAIAGGRIAAVGDVDYTRGPETEVIDAEGGYLTPGLIDAHLHMYHSYLGVNEFVEGSLLSGTTTYADGFYGQGIVGGADAVRFFKDAFDATPLRLIFLVPTLSWLQNRELGLKPGPGISVEDMHEMLAWDGCHGLEEPPFLPVVDGWDDLLDLLDATLEQGKIITGHAAGINSRQAQAFVAAGVTTDHETVGAEEAVMKARIGFKLLMRQGSGAFDVPELVKAYTEYKIDPRQLAFCSDLASPEKLLNEGTISENIRVAIANGVPPLLAVQMGTINNAEAFHLEREIGVLAPGRHADILLVDELRDFRIQRVLAGGETVVEDGRLTVKLPAHDYPKAFFSSVHLERPITPEDLAVRASGDGPVEVRVIGITENSLVTDERRATLKLKDGIVMPDIEKDVLPLAMVDRFGKGTGAGAGFVQGFRLERGAIASSVNAVCENLVAVGTNTEDMTLAMNTLAEVGGGKVVVADGEVLTLVELPLLGLLSPEPLAEIAAKFDRAFAEIANLGCPLRNPFSQLEFCFACGEIGDIRLSDEGLLRVEPCEMLEVVLA